MGIVKLHGLYGWKIMNCLCGCTRPDILGITYQKRCCSIGKIAMLMAEEPIVTESMNLSYAAKGLKN